MGFVAVTRAAPIERYAFPDPKGYRASTPLAITPRLAWIIRWIFST